MDHAGLSPGGSTRAPTEPPARARPTRIAFRALGCRVNGEEVECLRGRFADEGFEVVPFDGEAEVYVVNTCTVTGVADAESRKVVRRAVRRRPEGGLVVVTGCYAQRDPEALRALCGADLVLGNDEKGRLFEHVRRHLADRRLAGELWVGDEPTTGRFLAHGRSLSPSGHEGRTRATLKVQDGCDERCTYCIIPSVRGASVSRPAAEVLAEVRTLAAQGYREVALTGVNTGCYGHDLGDRDGLAALVRRLQDLDLPLRYRLNSLEPETVTGPLLDALADSPAFCRHFHVPMQHGDSGVLKRMGRGYGPGAYRERVLAIAARFPGAGLGADYMVGFPGEDEAAFGRGRAFVASLPLSYLHVFRWSERDGTPAARLPGRVADAEGQARSARMHALDADLRAVFQRGHEGREAVVLVEARPGPGGGFTGLTDGYLRVVLDATDRRPRPNELWRVRVGPALDPRLSRATPLAALRHAAARPAYS